MPLPRAPLPILLRPTRIRQGRTGVRDSAELSRKRRRSCRKLPGPGSQPILGVQPGEGCRIGIGARTKHQPVDEGKHAGVDPDADGQGQYDGNRDQLRIPGHAESVPEVPNQIVQPKQEATSATERIAYTLKTMSAGEKLPCHKTIYTSPHLRVPSVANPFAHCGRVTPG